MGLIPSQGTKILYATCLTKKIKYYTEIVLLKSNKTVKL